MRSYTKIALAISAVLCCSVILFTVNNVPEYNKRYSQDALVKDALLKSVKHIEATDSLLLSVTDSIASISATIINEEDSIKTQLKSSLKKLDNINRSVRNVRLR